MKKIRSIKEEKDIAFLDPKHIKVLRVQTGEKVKILLSDGRFAIGEVILEGKAQIIDFIPPIEPKHPIYLIISMLKRQKSEQVIEFSSQIGVKKIIPVITERVEIEPGYDKKIKIIERFKKLSLENSRVSGTKPPEINEIIDMKKVPEILDKEGINTRFVFWENSNNIFKLDIIKKVGKGTAVFVGPEGGFSEREIDFLRKCGFSDFSLGEKIIKAEFFPMYICSIIDFITNIE